MSLLGQVWTRHLPWSRYIFTETLPLTCHSPRCQYLVNKRVWRIWPDLHFTWTSPGIWNLVYTLWTLSSTQTLLKEKVDGWWPTRFQWQPRVQIPLSLIGIWVFDITLELGLGRGSIVSSSRRIMMELLVWQIGFITQHVTRVTQTSQSHVFVTGRLLALQADNKGVSSHYRAGNFAILSQRLGYIRTCVHLASKPEIPTPTLEIPHSSLYRRMWTQI